MSYHSFVPRSVLITGAAGAVGTALAKAYACSGVHLHLCDIRPEKLEALAQACRDAGAEATPAVVDVRDREAMTRWIDEADALKPLDLVMAIAGISCGTAKTEETQEELRRVFAVNLDGMLNTIWPALAHMRQRGRGQIALISSQAGARGFPVAPSYSATKAATRIYGEALRARLKRENIGVTVINPGFIKSPMTDANPYFMPLRVPAEDAARIIKEGLLHNKAAITFPWLFALGAALLGFVPSSWFVQFTALK